MNTRGINTVVALCVAIAALVGLASGAGILLRGDLATTAFTTVRGEHVDVVTGGIYAWNSENIVAEGVGWDIVTLFLVLPAFAATLPFLRRGSLRAALVATGLLAYFLYQYFQYAVYWAIGPLYPVFVAIVALTVTAMALVLVRIDVAALPQRFGDRFPRRAMTGLGVFMTLLLLGLWVPTVAKALGGQIQDVLFGGATLVVPAFDLGLLVPLGVFAAVTVWRRQPAGYLLGSVVVVKAIAMPTAIVAMLVVEMAATGVNAIPPMVIFGATALVSLAVAIRLFASLDAAPVPAAPARRAATPA